eukprot:2471274-Alexandrium_andersonii.AAC.1
MRQVEQAAEEVHDASSVQAFRLFQDLAARASVRLDDMRLQGSDRAARKCLLARLSTLESEVQQ